VIVHAEGGACRTRSWRTRTAARAVIFLLVCCSAAPAAAEIGATVSVFSDARFRGYSLSSGQPVGIIDFAYDDPSGFYADAAVTGVVRRDGDPALLGGQLTGGYARRLKSGTTLDFGITHSSYSNYSSSQRGTSYTEVYAGISRGAISSRIFLSPHYFASGHWTAYGEVNANVSPARKWSLNGHVGLLVPLRTPSGEAYGSQTDWRIGVSRQVGRLSLHAAWSDGSPGKDFYYGRYHSRSAVVVGATWVL
jgi:uncharacterized protein (TIGR02001 family)